MRIMLNDRFHKGKAEFESNGDTATLMYISDIKPPLNSRYLLEGVNWKVVSIENSNYVSGVIKLGLEKV